MVFGGFERSSGGDITAKWPRNALGEPEEAVFLVRCRANDLKDELTANMLEAYGIPCLCVYPGDGSFGKVVIGMSGTGTDILVPKSMLEEARNLLEGEITDENL